MMWEDQFTGGPGVFNKQAKQTIRSMQCSSMDSYSVLASMFLPQVPALTSPDDGLTSCKMKEILYPKLI